MPDKKAALYVQLAKRREMLKKWASRIIVFIAILIIAAEAYSRLYSEETLTSRKATLDAMVHLVGPHYSAKLSSIDVTYGQAVDRRQVLAHMDISEYLIDEEEYKKAAYIKKYPDYKETLDKIQAIERELQEKGIDRVYENLHRTERVYEDKKKYYYNIYNKYNSAKRRGLDNRDLKEAVLRAREEMELASQHYEEARAVYYGTLKQNPDITLKKKKLRELRITMKFIEDHMRTFIPPERKNVGNGEILAYEQGIVLRARYQPGQKIPEGSAIFAILPTENGKKTDPWILAWFPDWAKKYLKLGQKAEITFTDNGRQIKGYVDAIGADALKLPEKGDRRATSLSKIDRSGQREYTENTYFPVRIMPDNMADIADILPGAAAQCRIKIRRLF